MPASTKRSRSRTWAWSPMEPARAIRRTANSTAKSRYKRSSPARCTKWAYKRRDLRPEVPLVYRLVSLGGRPGDGVRGRYGGLGGVCGRGGFRVSVRARERDRQLGGLSPGL